MGRILRFGAIGLINTALGYAVFVAPHVPHSR